MFVIDPDTCTACDSCMDACPCDAISIVDGVHTIDPDLCVDCGACTGPIPAMAPYQGAILKPTPRQRSHCHPQGSAPLSPKQAPATTGHSARSQLLRNSARSQSLQLSANQAQRQPGTAPATSGSSANHPDHIVSRNQNGSSSRNRSQSPSQSPS